MMELNQQTPINKFYGNADEAAENADLHININPAARTAPAAPQPTFQPTLIPTQQPMMPASTNGERIGAAEINNETPVSKTTTTQVKQETHINWGGVAKGAAIIGAVVLVGVVGWWAMGSVATAALGNATVSSLAGSVSAVASPVINAVTYGGHWLAGFVTQVPGIVAGFGSTLLGTGGAGLTLAGEASTIGAAHVVGAAGGVVLGAPIAAHALNHVHVIDHSTVTQTNIEPHGAPDTHDAQAHDTNFFQDIFATKGAMTTQAAMADHSAMHIDHTNATAVEQLGHHSAHSAHEDGHGELADSAAEAHGKPHNKWADRMGSRPIRSSAPGNFASSVLANKSNTPAIAPRGASFSEALDNDRAKLDAALGETTR